MTTEPLSTNYLLGKAAFESGNYRQAVGYLEAAVAEISPKSKLGGEVQLWLVTAYEASGGLDAAIDLCTKLTTHPQLTTRQESKRVLYILQAPELTRRDEWVIKIPDLQDIEENLNSKGSGAQRKSRPVPVRKMPPPPPIDPSKIETKDNGFIQIMLGAALLAVVSLWLVSKM
jgi:tetratricopeptide (TPR) repeat protein